MKGMREIKSMVVLSNVQLFKRDLPMYSRYMEEPHNPQIVVLTINDSSYI